MLATWGCATFPKPTLDLQFEGATSLDSRITFTRGSTATYFNSAGVLTTANNNVARFDYDPSTLAPRGLLIEEARTNLLLQSQTFQTTWTTTRARIETDVAAAPDGTLTADKLIPNTDANTHTVIQNVTLTAQSYTYSVFLKQAEYTAARILMYDGTSVTYGAIFNLATGALVSTSGSPVATSIVSAGNGYWRCSITINGTAGTGNIQVRPVSGGTDNFAGNDSNGILVWGAQLEAGAFATSYIPTTTTALTRSADVASMTGTNFSSWYNAVEGTIVSQYQRSTGVPLTTAAVIVGLSDGTTTNRIQTNINTSGDTAFISNSTGFGVKTATSAVTKTALAYKLNDMSAFVTGTSIGTATGAVPVVDRMNIGSRVDSSNYLIGHIQRISYYPARLADSQLQALTA